MLTAAPQSSKAGPRLCQVRPCHLTVCDLGTSLGFLELQSLPVMLIIAQKKSNFYLYTL